MSPLQSARLRLLDEEEVDAEMALPAAPLHVRQGELVFGLGSLIKS